MAQFFPRKKALFTPVILWHKFGKSYLAWLGGLDIAFAAIANATPLSGLILPPAHAHLPPHAPSLSPSYLFPIAPSSLYEQPYLYQLTLESNVGRFHTNQLAHKFATSELAWGWLYYLKHKFGSCCVYLDPWTISFKVCSNSYMLSSVEKQTIKALNTTWCLYWCTIKVHKGLHVTFPDYVHSHATIFGNQCIPDFFFIVIYPALCICWFLAIWCVLSGSISFLSNLGSLTIGKLGIRRESWRLSLTNFRDMESTAWQPNLNPP